jgi:hypothetical protein
MPAYAYSQYKDPKTGKIKLLPQLYPFATSTGEILKEELENFINKDMVLRDLYESEMQNHQKMKEISKKIRNGEQIHTSELPLAQPSFTDYFVKNKAHIFGENVLAKIFLQLNDNDPDIVWLSFIKEALTSIVTKDPIAIHYYVATKTLKEKYNIEHFNARDILAREFLEHCRKILNFEAFSHPSFQKIIVDPEDCFDHFEDKEGILNIDLDFINFLNSIGGKGKKLSKSIKENCFELFSFYKKQNFSSNYRRNVWSLWVPQQNELISPFMSVLTQALWEDRCVHLWSRKITGNPSLPKPVFERFIPILGPKKNKQFIEKEGQIICCDQKGEPLLMAPAVDVNMISAFQKGVKELGTLTGHKMLRWQVNTGFQRWQDGEKDPRLIEVDGGYSGIAELTGCKSTQEISKIRDILHVQAHGHFIFPDGSHGNMLTLRVEDRHRNNEPSKIRIVLGDMLLPAYVCQLQRSDRRLIPIADLPPLHGSYNSHASQAQLQLHVFSEFSNQSDRLAKFGSVLITLDMWQKMASESGLNPEKINDVVAYWCQPDLFNCFLEKQGDEYKLATYYERAQKFLEIQGQRRIINSERGKKSVENRRGKSKKK